VSRDQFGDFQTPPALARDVCGLLAAREVAPRAVLEPTCGTGAFLEAAVATFADLDVVIGADVNAPHLRAARRRVPHATLHAVDCFTVDWTSLIGDLPHPLLIVGNPPWVTNAAVGALGGTNLPAKSNFQRHVGLDARTGRSNFDVSEWMLIRLFDAIRDRTACVAMLCKTAVARKALAHAWTRALPLVQADLYPIDAVAHFGANVPASLLVCRFGPGTFSLDCTVHSRLAESPAGSWGWRDGWLVADSAAYERTRHLVNTDDAEPRWRSGIKHDCATAMELVVDGDRYRNGLGERVDLEPDHLHPMLKGSDLANGRAPTRVMLTPQSFVGEATDAIRVRAPKTWSYLQDHAPLLDRRASSIYRDRPRFAIFGVGAYAFAPWKVAVPALYKQRRFRVVGPHDGKPVVLDDTCYFITCGTRREAERLAALLDGADAERFFRAFVFRDAKRPVTIELLRRLDLARLATSARAVEPQHLDDDLGGAHHVADAEPLLHGVDVAHAGAEVRDEQAAAVQHVGVAAAAHRGAFDLMAQRRGRP
jgi:hypothetical protein